MQGRPAVFRALLISAPVANPLAFLPAEPLLDPPQAARLKITKKERVDLVKRELVIPDRTSVQELRLNLGFFSFDCEVQALEYVK